MAWIRQKRTHLITICKKGQTMQEKKKWNIIVKNHRQYIHKLNITSQITAKIRPNETQAHIKREQKKKINFLEAITLTQMPKSMLSSLNGKRANSLKIIIIFDWIIFNFHIYTVVACTHTYIYTRIECVFSKI